MAWYDAKIDRPELNQVLTGFSKAWITDEHPDGVRQFIYTPFGLQSSQYCSGCGVFHTVEEELVTLEYWKSNDSPIDATIQSMIQP
jgi:hypothetical protein